MNIEVTTDNCDKENYYLVECAADGELPRAYPIALSILRVFNKLLYRGKIK
jgi:hypothetical protein